MDKRKISFLFVTSCIFVWFCGNYFQESFVLQNDKRVHNTYTNDKIMHTTTRQWEADYAMRKFDTIDDVVNIAKKMNTSPVMVTFVNDAYLPLVYNWLCNTVSMNVHNKILMITTSHSTKENIKTKYNNLTICVIQVDKSLQGDQSYSQVGYVELMIIRTRLITALLIGGIETFQFECDFLWIKNPTEMLHEHKGKYDALFIKSYDSNVEVNGGFLYLFATNRTQSLFLEVRRQMDLLEGHIKQRPKHEQIPDIDNDQRYLSRLLNKQFAGVKALVLPYSDFADGWWYRFDAAKRKSIKPYIIHNNYIVGNHAKINRIKQFGHWFLGEDSNCKSNIFKSVTQAFL